MVEAVFVVYVACEVGLGWVSREWWRRVCGCGGRVGCVGDGARVGKCMSVWGSVWEKGG